MLASQFTAGGAAWITFLEVLQFAKEKTKPPVITANKIAFINLILVMCLTK